MPRAKPRLALFGHEASVEILAQLSSEHTVTQSYTHTRSYHESASTLTCRYHFHLFISYV